MTRLSTVWKAFYYVSDKFDELGLELTEEDKTSIDSLTSGLWPYYRTAMETFGVSKDSLQPGLFHLQCQISKSV